MPSYFTNALPQNHKLYNYAYKNRHLYDLYKIHPYSPPQLENFGTAEGDPLACHCASRGARARPRSGTVRAQLLSAACAARRHLRLEGLRTLVSEPPTREREASPHTLL